MKRTILSLMMFGLFAGAQTAAVAQNVTADDKSGESAQTGNTQGSDANAPKATNGAKPNQAGKDGVVARPLSKSELESVRAQAQTRYDAAKAKCEAMSGNAMRMCMTDAKTARAAELSKAQRPTEGRDDTQQPGNQAPRKNVKSGSAPSSGAATAQDSTDRGGVEGAAAGNTDMSNARSTEGRDDTQQPANQAPRKNVKSGTTPSTGAATTSEPGDRGGQPASAAANPDPSGPRSSAGYNAAQEMAQSRYDYAASKCNSLSTNAARDCMADALKARTEALAAAKVEWESGMQRDDSSQKRPVSDRNGSDGVTPTSYEVPSDMATSGTSR